MKRTVRNCVIFVSIIALCTIFALTLALTTRNAIPVAPTKSIDRFSTPINAVSIKDLTDVKILKFDYFPNEFLELNEEATPATDGKLAMRGTYRIFIDTLSIEEKNEAHKLDGILGSDGNWHVTMYLPQVFSASSVIVKYNSVVYTGKINGYNLNYYIQMSAPNETDATSIHVSQTEPHFVDISISANLKLSIGCMILIHYETDNPNFVGINGNVLIGKDSAVRKAFMRDNLLLYSLTIIAATTFVVFVFICALQRSLSFAWQLLLVAAIFLAFLSSFLLREATTVVYFLIAVRRVSVGIMLIAATLYLPSKIKKVPVRGIVVAIATVASILAFVSPFIKSVDAYNAVTTTYACLAFVAVAFVAVFTFYDLCKGKPLHIRLNSAVACVLVVTSILVRQTSPYKLLSPSLWLCFVALVITLVIGFREFILMEIRNRYLTSNLSEEVAKQTQELQDIVFERNKLLLYISHDMKKPVLSLDSFLTDLSQQITDEHLVAKIQFMRQKCNELKKDFSEIGTYGKLNYLTEQSEVFNICDIVHSAAEKMRPDCEANGIVLAVTTPETLNVYAKKNALESVIFNLILNAIDHSCCKNLFVTVAKRKAICKLEISDDGIGIATDKDVFQPFVSADPSENNLGLGLFLARESVQSMHGEIVWKRQNDITVFTVTLPLA